MTLQDAKRELERIRATAQDLQDDEAASSLERALLIDAIEAVIMGKIEIKTLEEIMRCQTIQFRRWGP